LFSASAREVIWRIHRDRTSSARRPLPSGMGRAPVLIGPDRS
jgi:hypothetical protein